MNTHLFIYPGAAAVLLPNAPGVGVSRLPADSADAANAVDTALRDADIVTLAFWDLRLGPVPWAALTRFGDSLDDAWHPGQRLSGPDEPDLLRHVEPMWVNRPSPQPDVDGAINWRLDPRAMFVRAQTMRLLGGLDRAFDSLPGMARDLGLRMLKRGGVCRQRPDLLREAAVLHDLPSLADRYRLVGRHFSWKWRAYTFARRMLELPAVPSEVRALLESADPRPASHAAPIGALHRDVSKVRLPEHIRVSAVLPTYGRYPYLAEVLEDLRAQTIKPSQIIIADGNALADQERDLYARFSDLPLEVIYHEGRGACAARNTCLPHTTGDYIWFVDDDSRFSADNLEAHLRVMFAYGADVSVGPAYTRNRPELHPEQREIACGFMDCGTTLIKRAMLEQIGGFDMQFSKNLPLEDAELGLRVIRAGGLMLNNPLAKRFHYLAPIGGGRRSRNNLHRWSRWSIDVPRPIQSVYYNARRHFEPEAVADAMFQACVLAGWRRPEGQPATTRTRLRTLAAEVAALPVTAMRLRRSIDMGKQMLAEGPMIPTLSPADDAQARAR